MSRHVSQGGPSSWLHLAVRAAKWRHVRTSGTPSWEGVVSIIRNGISRAPAASTAAPLSTTRIAPVLVSRDCSSWPEHRVPCRHGEGVK